MKLNKKHRTGRNRGVWAHGYRITISGMDLKIKFEIFFGDTYCEILPRVVPSYAVSMNSYQFTI